MQQDLSEIWMILDRSGSMSDLHAATVEAYNGFIRTQQQEPGRALYTLRQFDNEVLETLARVPLNEVLPLRSDQFVPRGSTALLDAVGQAIDDLGGILAKTPEAERPAKVILAILTDGMENASRKYGHAKVAEMIRHQRETYAWEFVFLASGMDVDAVAASLNILAEDRIAFERTAQSVHENMAFMSENISKKRRRSP
jgi:hypothetical protein